MTTVNFEDKETQFAYRAIHDFFNIFSLRLAEQEIEAILLAANESDVWKKGIPGDLLHCMNELTDLISAVYQLFYSANERQICIIDDAATGGPDMTATGNFMHGNIYTSIWDDFPRNLTEKQYDDPYRAIRKFCRYMPETDWKNVLKEITEYALSSDSIDVICPANNILKVRLRLMQLLEACHLITVRSAAGAQKKAGKKSRQHK